MAKRQSIILQSDANSLFKAARAAGYSRARFINHPDGRTEFIGEDGSSPVVDASASPFEQWKADNAG
ncbi:MAG: transcription factor iiib subunit [Shinella sp.]|nr:MAG: transcription factor iiib subunit [Shinella sp.]